MQMQISFIKKGTFIYMVMTPFDFVVQCLLFKALAFRIVNIIIARYINRLKDIECHLRLQLALDLDNSSYPPRLLRPIYLHWTISSQIVQTYWM